MNILNNAKKNGCNILKNLKNNMCDNNSIDSMCQGLNIAWDAAGCDTDESDPVIR